MWAIKAVGEFRKEKYVDAAASFEAYVTELSNHATKFLYGLSLYQSGNYETAVKWLGLATKENDVDKYRDALKDAEAALSGNVPTLPPRKKTKRINLGGINDKRPLGVDTPYKENAVSKLKGFGTAAKDFNWLKTNIPCQQACPAHTDIPGYLSQIYKGNFGAAYEINLRDNIFPGVLGRVCARPCEAQCRHGREGLGDSVAICFSKRSAADLKVNQRPVVLEKLYEESGKSIAIVGAGPSGLATARNLALLGHDVKVYEKHPVPGGMMVQGIPAFRLPREVVEREINQIQLLGVRIICNTEIGEDITLDQLVNDNNAVVMAAGTLRPNYLNMPGKELGGIRHGLDFLLEVNHHQDSLAGKNVIVIGGGFTAMDCARTAKRLGAKLIRLEEDESEKDWREHALEHSPTETRVLYRRSPEEMLVTPGEVEELGHEGIGMEFLVSPIEYIGENGKITAVKFIKNKLGEPDDSGRRRPVAIEGSEFEAPADLVLLATGQFPDTSWIDDSLKPLLASDDGWLQNYGEHTTDHPKIFMSGDFSTGAQSLIESIAHGKKTAQKVDFSLMGEKRLTKVAVIEDRPRGSERIVEMNDVERGDMPTLPIQKRSLNAEVELGFDPELAVDQTSRCYQCNVKYEIDPEKCIFCDWCIKAKPQDDCIVKVKALEYGPDGEVTGFVRAKNSEETTRIWMNNDDCIRCNACADACPVDAISVQRVSRCSVRTCDLSNIDFTSALRM